MRIIAPPVFVPEDKFSEVVRFAPLVSIDLIMRDPRDQILVGLRTNEPARGLYFLPGGVIRKNEPIREAFLRILRTETGCRARFEDANFVGVFEHFYPTNRFGDPAFGTHYVVLAYELRLPERPPITLDAQHSASRWMGEAEIIAAGDVHEHTKAYFAPTHSG